MAKKISQKVLRRGGVTVALTVLIVAAVILLNGSVTTLALRFGWYINMNPTPDFPVTDACYDFLDGQVMPAADEPIRLIFCESEENILADTTFSYVLSTARELEARYPDRIDIEHLNVWEQPSVARGYGVTSADAVVVVSGDRHRVCNLRDFFLFPADDDQTPVAYSGDRRFAVAMRAVVSEDSPRAYFTLNHGETLSDYSLMYTLIDAGYEVAYLDALNFDIPDDCALLVTYNPTRDYTAEDGISGISEVGKLDEYLARGGKFMVFVSADTFAAGSYTNLEGYLADWGVTFDHRPGAGGVEECFAIRDNAHALTIDGYTFVGRIPAQGNGADYMADIRGTLRLSNATGISVSDGFSLSDGNYVCATRTLSPLLLSHKGAEAYAGGRAVDRTADGYNLVTLTQDSATDGAVLVCSSIEFADEDSLQLGVYDNGAFLLSAVEAMGKEDVPLRLSSHPLSDDTIRTLTTRDARIISVVLVVLPALGATAAGLIVLIRRKFA